MLTGSTMECQEKHDRTEFQKHLKMKKACIYHGIIQGFEDMEKVLEDTCGIIVTVYFKSNNISYLDMYRLISHRAQTRPKLLTVGGNCSVEYRKWANFYMKKERADSLARKVKEEPELSKMFEIKFSNRMGENIRSGGRDWDTKMPDARTTLVHDDDLVFTFDIQIQAMKGDSIATAINTSFCSKVSSSSGAVKTVKMDGDKELKWESLEDVRLPSKTWDDAVSHTSSSQERSNQDSVNTTSLRQGAG